MYYFFKACQSGWKPTKAGRTEWGTRPRQRGHREQMGQAAAQLSLFLFGSYWGLTREGTQQ